MNTAAPGHAVDVAPPPRAGQGRRPARRRWAAAGAAVIVVAGVAVAVTDPFARPGQPALPGDAYHTATWTVRRQSLTEQTQVNATLGAGGSYSVVNQAQGTLTWLPSPGTVVRQGQVLYQVSGGPVVLLYGTVPAYRALSDGMTGPDVTQLNADLVRLGYGTASELDPRSDTFSLETAYALEKLQARLGVSVTGDLALGQAVFLPTAARITGLGASVVLGAVAQPGTTVLTATSTTPVVTIDLDPAEQTDVRDGDRVTITLPDGSDTPGVISSVGTVASTPSSDGSPGSTGAGSSPTITVEVIPAHPRAVAGLTSAPVTVTITTGSASNVLVVPVDALIAQPGGGYAVEVTGAGGARHLVAVSPGMFDDAAGLVQVSGPGLATGQNVVVPGT